MPPKQKQQSQRTDAELIAIIAGAIAIGAPLAATATSLSAVIGIPVATLSAVLKFALVKPGTYGPSQIHGVTTAAAESARVEPIFRAEYVLASSRRVHAEVSRGVSLDEATRRENQYYRQHLEAMLNRAKIAGNIDRMAGRYGDLLGWYAKLDNRTSPECREANGKNFNASVRPPIGYPGSVHPHCRCKPGKPFRTRATVYNIQTKDRVA